MSEAGPWQPPAEPALISRFAPTYAALAILTALMAVLFVPIHLVVGGMLSTFIVEWHTAHGLTSVLPRVLFYGGAFTILVVPTSFAVSSWHLYHQDSRAWRVLPWMTLAGWPSLIVGTSFLFDAVRFTY